MLDMLLGGGKIADMSEGPRSDRIKRVSVRYEGRVQGVGFRYTVVSLAARRPVTGYVQNEIDGSVTLVAEGAEADVVALLHDIRRTHLGRYISAERVAWSNATGEFSGFGIRHPW